MKTKLRYKKWKSIYSSHSGNKPSPIEAWNDKTLLDKCVRNRFIYGNTLSHKEIVHDHQEQ